MRFEKLRPYLLLAAFIAVVAFMLLRPSANKPVSASDILCVNRSVGGVERVITEDEEIGEFFVWLTDIVPVADLYFLREKFAPPADARAAFIVDQALEQTDDNEPQYSVYHMYIYVVNNIVYYNGVTYDLPPQAEDYINVEVSQ